MAGRLRGKVIIVTGGTRGIGEAVVRGIVREGGQVVFGGRDESAGKAIMAELGEATCYVRQDVTVRADWAKIVDTALDRFGRITGLVNNAGQLRVAELAKLSDQDFAYHVAVNQTAVLLGMQYVEEPMRRHGSGSIVNIGTPAGSRAVAGLVAYAATKAAIFGMSLSAMAELAPHNIRVNVIVPGMFDTRLLAESSDGRGRERAALKAPMKRIGEPVEMVGPVVFLLSDEASYVTGAVLSVDGGATAAAA